MEDTTQESPPVRRTDLDVEGLTLSIEREEADIAFEDRDWLWEATGDPARFLTSTEPARSRMQRT